MTLPTKRELSNLVRKPVSSSRCSGPARRMIQAASSNYPRFRVKMF